MIYLFFSSNARAFIETTTIEEAQKCVTEQMQLHSAYQTWQGVLASLDHFKGTISEVATYDKQLPQDTIKEHFVH